MPDTRPLQAHFGQPDQQKVGCGFPTATLLVLANAAGLIVKTLALPLRTHDASQIARLVDAMQRGDVLVYDRAACAFVHLALLFQHHMHAIFRMHQKQIISFEPGRKHASELPNGQRKGNPTSQWLRRLGRNDQLVKWFKPRQRPKWMTQQQYDALPNDLVLRELRYQVKRKGFRTRSITLVTTLIDAEQYPAAELAEQYRGRGDIELNLRHLKATMKMDVLKCKTLDGVQNELAVFVLVYNLVRLIMLGAAERQKVPPDRISFADALRWLSAARDAHMLIDLIVNPRRPGRVEPRVIKRRPNPYSLMTKPRAELRQTLLSKRVTT